MQPYDTFTFKSLAFCHGSESSASLISGISPFFLFLSYQLDIFPYEPRPLIPTCTARGSFLRSSVTSSISVTLSKLIFNQNTKENPLSIHNWMPKPPLMVLKYLGITEPFMINDLHKPYNYMVNIYLRTVPPDPIFKHKTMNIIQILLYLHEYSSNSYKWDTNRKALIDSTRVSCRSIHTIQTHGPPFSPCICIHTSPCISLWVSAWFRCTRRQKKGLD